MGLGRQWEGVRSKKAHEEKEHPKQKRKVSPRTWVFFAPASMRNRRSQLSAISMVFPQILVICQSISIDFLSFSISFNQLHSVFISFNLSLTWSKTQEFNDNHVMTTGRWGKQHVRERDLSLRSQLLQDIQTTRKGLSVLGGGGPRKVIRDSSFVSGLLGTSFHMRAWFHPYTTRLNSASRLAATHLMIFERAHSILLWAAVCARACPNYMFDCLPNLACFASNLGNIPLTPTTNI